jgi:hypothetical protein
MSAASASSSAAASSSSSSASVNARLGATLQPHPVEVENIAKEVLQSSTIGLSINYEQLVVELSALLTSPKETRLQLISNKLSDAMTTLVKQSTYKLIQPKHRNKNYFKNHITKAFPIFFDKLQEELATESPGYSDLLRTIFPKWIKSDTAREILEAQDPTYQCDVTRGPWYTQVNDGTGTTKKRGCWICGHELHLWKGSLPGPQCEHKSPVLLAMLHYRLVQIPLKLYNITYTDEEQRSLGEVVLEWSCVLCNMVKNALNLILEDKQDGIYKVHEDNVNKLIEDIQNKLGKVNLGKTKAQKLKPSVPVWDGNSLFLTDDEYQNAVRNKAVIETIIPNISELKRTDALDKTINNKQEIIQRARTQFDNNKDNMIDALQELANVSNTAIGLVKSNIESTGAHVTQYQSYEIYTLLTSVRLLCNIHERKLIQFMIEAIDNPDAKPNPTTTYPKASKVTKVTKVKATAATKSKRQKSSGGNWQKGGGDYMVFLIRKFPNLEFVINQFETLIIAFVIENVKDNWAIFSDYVDLCILEENELDITSDYVNLGIEEDNTADVQQNKLEEIKDEIRNKFVNNRDMFIYALNKSLYAIYDLYSDDFRIIRTHYEVWNHNWRNRKELLDDEFYAISDAYDSDAETSLTQLDKNKIAQDTKEKRDLFHEVLDQAMRRRNNPYQYAMRVTHANSPAIQQAREINRILYEPFTFRKADNLGRVQESMGNSQSSASTTGTFQYGNHNIVGFPSPTSSVRGENGSQVVDRSRSRTPPPLNVSSKLGRITENPTAAASTMGQGGSLKRHFTRRMYRNKRITQNKKSTKKRNRRNTQKKNRKNKRNTRK